MSARLRYSADNANPRSARLSEMGPTRFELVTSSLSGTRSNQLSYEPALPPTAIAGQAANSKGQADRVNLGFASEALHSCRYAVMLAIWLGNDGTDQESSC
jgi:hypothetical protein